MSLLHRPFQPRHRHLRCENKTNSSPRPPLTSPSTPFHRLLQRQPPRLHAQRGKRSFHLHDHSRYLRPTFMDYYILTAGRTQSTAVRDRHAITGSRSEPSTPPTNTIHCALSDHWTPTALLPHRPRLKSLSRLERRNVSLQDLLSRFIGRFFVQPLHHQVPQ